MTLAAIWREVWRDVVSGTSRTLTFALILAAVVLGLGATDIVTVRALTAAAERFQAAGASIITLDAPGRIDPAACSALASVSGVRAAGAIRAGTESLTPLALPSSTIPVIEVTPSLPEVLRTQIGSAGVILSEQAAQTLTVRPGSELQTSETTATVAGVYGYPEDGRRPGLGFAALVPTTDGEAFDECWVDIWPTSPQTPALLQTTLLPDDETAAGQNPTLTQLNTTLGTAFDGRSRFDVRVTRLAPWGVLGIGVGLGYLSVRLRRVPLASALHAGTTRQDLGAVVMLETLSWALPATLLAAVAIVVATKLGGDLDARHTVVLGSRTAVAGMAGPLLGSTFGYALTRERHLFRYFKDR